MKYCIVRYQLTDSKKVFFANRWLLFQFAASYIMQIETIEQRVREKIIADKEYNYSFEITYINIC